MNSTMIAITKLKNLASHPEYGCKKIADMRFSDLREPNQMNDLLKSVSQFGIQNPLVIEQHESGEQILADGHHRALAAIYLGLNAVPMTIRNLGA